MHEEHRKKIDTQKVHHWGGGCQGRSMVSTGPAAPCGLCFQSGAWCTPNYVLRRGGHHMTRPRWVAGRDKRPWGGVGAGQGCIRREDTSEAAPAAVRQAVGGGCQSGWGRLLSVINATEAGTWREGDSGWA